MKKKNLLLILTMQILLVLPLIAQEHFINDVIAKPLKASTLNAKNGDTINDYQQEQQLIDSYLKKINPNFSAGELKVIVDLINKKHYRCNVFYKQIPIDGYRLTLHPLTDTTLSITGMNLFNKDISVIPSLSKEQAIEKIKLENSSITTEMILSNELVIYKSLASEPHLSYKIDLFYSDIEAYRYYISAINGEIIKKNALVYNSTPEIGSANLYIWGSKNIFTSYKSIGNKYILFDQTANIHTYNINGSTNTNKANDFTDLDNNWTLAEFPETNSYSMNAALVCHWGARKTYDFFFTTFNRNGFNGNNKKLKIYVNYGGNSEYGANAYWSFSKDEMYIGSGRNDTLRHHYGTIDIVAHEFGHAITDYMVEQLDYAGESGAIHEGISDIWAACVENYIGGQTDYEIWNIGDHRGYSIRCISNPNSKGDPDTYGKRYWVNTTDISKDNDYGGVHSNSGILSYWFYLLTMGGSGTNDNQEPYEVEGIGFSISQHILYQTLLSYIERNSNFHQMRTSTLQATMDLYGTSSDVYKQVMNAWHAVGVGEPYMDANIEGDFGVCDGGVYSIDKHPAVSITWSVDKFDDVFSQRDKLTFVSGQGTGTIVVNRGVSLNANQDGTLYKYKGPVLLTATLTYENTTITKQKSLFSNNPLPEIEYTTTQESSLSSGKIYRFYVGGVATNHLSWTINANGNTYMAIAQNFIEINLPTLRTYDVIVSVRDHGNCSSSNYKTLTLKGMLVASPTLSHENPVNTNSTFYLRKETSVPSDDAIYNIEIWNDYGLVRSEQYEDATEFMISTEGLIPSIYFMRIYRNGELLSTQKLIVK